MLCCLYSGGLWKIVSYHPILRILFIKFWFIKSYMLNCWRVLGRAPSLRIWSWHNWFRNFVYQACFLRRLFYLPCGAPCNWVKTQWLFWHIFLRGECIWISTNNLLLHFYIIILISNFLSDVIRRILAIIFTTNYISFSDLLIQRL